MSIKERYLINKINPKYNKQYNNSSQFSFEINGFNWNEFTDWEYKKRDSRKNIRLDTRLIGEGMHLESSIKNIEKLKNEINSTIIKINNIDYIIVDIHKPIRAIDIYGNEKTSEYHKAGINLCEKIQKMKKIIIPQYKILFQVTYAKTKNIGVNKDAYLKLPGIITFMKISEFEKVLLYYKDKKNYAKKPIGVLKNNEAIWRIISDYKKDIL